MEFSHFFSKIPIECDFAYYSSVLGLVAIDQNLLSFCEDLCLFIPFHCADNLYLVRSPRRFLPCRLPADHTLLVMVIWVLHRP